MVARWKRRVICEDYVRVGSVCVWGGGGGEGGCRVCVRSYILCARVGCEEILKSLISSKGIKKQAVACNAEQRHKLLF